MDLSRKYYSQEALLNIDGTAVPVEIWADESGETGIEVLEETECGPPQEPFEDMVVSFKKLTGFTPEEYNVVAKNTTVQFGDKASTSSPIKRFVSEISDVRTVTITKNPEYTFEKSDTVTVRFDISCFKPVIPYEVSRGELLFERDEWAATTSPVGESKERIDQIKKLKRPIRTAEVRITQEIPGTVEHHINSAVEKIERILPLSGFAFGVGPAYISAQVETINGIPADSNETELHFTKLYTTQASIGGAFIAGNLVNWNSYIPFLQFAYRGYTNQIAEDYKLRQVLGYYWDALNQTRPIEGQYLSVCSAIELLAKRHVDHHGGSGRTQEKIERLIDSLEVETEDLASFAGTSNRTSSQKYFYSYTRQYVVHGDNNPNMDELIDDYYASLTLLQRIIKNLLLKEQDYPDKIMDELLPPSHVSYN